MTEHDQPRRRRGRPKGTGRAPTPPAPDGLVRVEVISAKHAFGEGGRKYLCGETPAVPEAIAEDWIKNGRAQRI